MPARAFFKGYNQPVFRSFWIALICGVFVARAGAATVAPLSFDQLVNESTTVVYGRVADVRDATVRIFQNPFVISMFLGATFSGMGWTLVTPFAEIVKLLADAAGPCALFAIGVSLVRPDASLRAPIIALPVAAKLLIHPLIVWLAMRAFHMDEFTTLVAVLTAALPSAGWVFIFAVRYEADAGRVSATILVSTAVAFVTFSGLVWMLGVGRAA